jgi:hypothetical protein
MVYCELWLWFIDWLLFLLLLLCIYTIIVGLKIITTNQKNYKKPTVSSTERQIFWNICWQFNWNLHTHSKTFDNTIDNVLGFLIK